MSLDFKLSNTSGKITDNFLLLTLIQQTNEGKLKWSSYSKTDISEKFVSFFNIPQTKKSIRIEYFVNMSSTEYCYIRFLFEIRGYSREVRMIRGSNVLSLLFNIKNKQKDG